MNTSQKPTGRTDQLIIAAVVIAGLIFIAGVCAVVVLVASLIFGFTFFMPAPLPLGTAAPLPFVTATRLPSMPASPTPVPPLEEPTRSPYDEVPLPPTEAGELLPGGPDGAGSHPLLVDIPPRDRIDLARRFRGVTTFDPPQPVSYSVGDVIPFWVDNDDTERTVRVMAELVYVNDVVYMWVEQGVEVDYQGLVRSAERFRTETYPTNRSYFGSEAYPGIDGDPRLHILHSTQLGSGVAGYFFSPSEYPESVVPYSNEKEVFFISVDGVPPGTDYYDGVLAHEFQHMIHWNIDQNEESWVNEGLSELAVFLNGLGTSGFIPYFTLDPDLQLNDWPADGGGASYGSAFLFNAYFLDRFGHDAVRMLVANRGNGLAAYDQTLEQIGAGATADDVFADWVIANLLNDTSIPPGVYGYSQISDLFPVQIIEGFSVFPVDSGWRQVRQYGTDYIQISGPGDFALAFEGSPQVRIIPANTRNTDGDPATDDRYVWWSNRGDDSDMTLTRQVDLTTVSQAVLEYDVWYSIEDLWDYAYLTISADNGQTWTILPTPHTTIEDPHGNSYGFGYSGESWMQFDASPEGWLHETIDLSAYAGQEVLLRFELITDDAVNQPGLALDNICIDAINWCDNAESDPGDWEASGFVRHSNLLEQRFMVQVIVPEGSGGTQVLRVPLDAANRGEIAFTLRAGQTATLVVSGLTRYTTEPATYRYLISRTGG